MDSGLILILVSWRSDEVSWPDDELNGRAAAWAATHKAQPRAGRVAHPCALFAPLDDANRVNILEDGHAFIAVVI